MAQRVTQLDEQQLSQLVSEAQSGDEAALHDLLGWAMDYLFPAVLGMLHERRQKGTYITETLHGGGPDLLERMRDDAWAITHSACCRMTLRIDTFNGRNAFGRKVQFGTWVYAIARNEMRTLLRSRWRERKRYGGSLETDAGEERPTLRRSAWVGLDSTETDRSADGSRHTRGAAHAGEAAHAGGSAHHIGEAPHRTRRSATAPRSAGSGTPSSSGSSGTPSSSGSSGSPSSHGSSGSPSRSPRSRSPSSSAGSSSPAVAPAAGIGADELGVGLSPESTVLDRLDSDLVREALRKAPLTPEQREAVVLFHGYGYRQEQIAELTGVQVGTVKKRVFDGLRKLRDYVGKRA